jgi:hypothetical protein
MVIGPHIRDVFGREMDQDNNGIPGETPQDQYTATFTVAAPQVVSSSPTGSTPAPINHVLLTFNSPMDGSTFTPGKVSFTGPGGAIAVSGVTEVPYTNHTQFDVTFAPQTAVGTYLLVVGPNIADVYGNTMTTSFTAALTILPPNLVTNGGFETGSFSGWTQSGDTGFTSVNSGSPDGTTIHSGSHAGQFGPSTLGFLTQTLATTAGVSYTLDFWLSHPNSDSGTEWLVRVGGTTLMDVHNAGNFGYTEFTFTFTATSSSTALQFGFAEPPAYFYLDDVSVTAN